MPDYYEYEEYSSRRRDDRSRERSRNRSPDYYSGGSRGGPRDGDDRDDDGVYDRSRHRSGSGMMLQVPGSDARPRSVPPPNSAAVVPRPRSPSRSGSYMSDRDRDRDMVRRSRSYRDDSDSDDDRAPPRSPIDRAKHMVDNNFTHTPTGIGAGLVGAVVGGLVARQASDVAARHRHKDRGSRYYDDEDKEGDNRTRMVSTILGAVAGGLGANAIANRVEDSREKGREKQAAWEQRFGGRDDRDRSRERDRDHHRDSRRRGGYDSEDEDDYDFVSRDRRYDDRRPSSSYRN